MSEAPRKVVAEIELQAENRARVEVGARTLYHYWPLLQSHYRGVLLPPQRRTDGARVAWQWLQEPAAGLPSTEEIKTLRRDLSDAHRRLVDAWSEGVPGSSLTAEEAETLRNRLGRIVANLVSLPERELLGYLAHTTDGLQIHSWGAEQPGELRYPDEQVLSIRGRVRQGDAPVVGAAVSLEDEDGRSLDQVRSDASGFYGFYQLKPGEYRVKAVSAKASFAPEGVGASLQTANLDAVDLVASDPAPRVDVIDGSTPARTRRGARVEDSTGGRRFWFFVGLGLLTVAGGVGYWFLRPTPSPTRPTRVAPSPAPLASRASVAPGPRPSLPPASGERGVRRPVDVDAPLTARKSVREVAVDDESLYAAFERADHLAGHSSGGDPDAPPGPTAQSSRPGEAPATGAAAEGATPASSAAAPEASAAQPNQTGGGEPGTVASPDAAGTPGPSDGTPRVHGAAASAGQPKTKAAPRALTPSADPRPGRATPTPRAPSPDPRRPSSPAASDDRASARAPTPAALAPTSLPARSTAAAMPGKTPAPIPAEAVAEPEPTPEPDAGSGGLRKEPPPEPDARWQAPQRLTLGGWRVSLFADAIVPTLPLPAGVPVDLTPLQERAWLTRRQNQPPWLRSPRLIAGLLFHLPVDLARQRPRWQGAPTDRPVVAHLRGTRAELGWYGGAPTQTATFTLASAEGVAWAHVRTGAGGELSLQLREGVRAFYWAAVEPRATGGAATDWARWRWATDEGWALPPNWVSREVEATGQQRLEIPLDAGTEDAGRWRIRWLDTDTLWGIGGEFAVRSDGAVTP